jgi:hypothetical protein
MTMDGDRTLREDDRAVERDADAERDSDDVAAPDAPTATEENEGMSTILSADTADGVQMNKSDE